MFAEETRKNAVQRVRNVMKKVLFYLMKVMFSADTLYALTFRFRLV